jgi:hypothetical protein
MCQNHLQAGRPQDFLERQHIKPSQVLPKWVNEFFLQEFLSRILQQNIWFKRAKRVNDDEFTVRHFGRDYNKAAPVPFRLYTNENGQWHQV